MTQAVDLQFVNHQAALQIATDFRHAATPAERKDLLPYLAKATDAWRIATDARHNAQGKPRAGQLSASERAEMRRAKSSRARQSAPKLSAPVPTVAPTPEISQ